MKTFRQVLVCALLAALTGLVVCAMALVRAATMTVSVLPGQVSATREALLGQVQAARTDLLVRSERQVTAMRHDVKPVLDAAPNFLTQGLRRLCSLSVRIRAAA
jgi:hypothetical protein